MKLLDKLRRQLQREISTPPTVEAQVFAEARSLENRLSKHLHDEDRSEYEALQERYRALTGAYFIGISRYGN